MGISARAGQERSCLNPYEPNDVRIVHELELECGQAVWVIDLPSDDFQRERAAAQVHRLAGGHDLHVRCLGLSGV
jgi:hypothetical protein